MFFWAHLANCQALIPCKRFYITLRGKTRKFAILFINIYINIYINLFWSIIMTFNTSDIVPFSRVRSQLTELAEAARDGHEKIITRNGESYIAMIDARKLDYYHKLEREHIHLALIVEAEKGLDDVKKGHFI